MKNVNPGCCPPFRGTCSQKQTVGRVKLMALFGRAIESQKKTHVEEYRLRWPKNNLETRSDTLSKNHLKQKCFPE